MRPSLRASLTAIFLLLPVAAAIQESAGDTAVSAENEKSWTVANGTRIPLSMINSVSTKHAAEGDRIYLETVFPVLVDGRIVIPPGSYVAGTVTSVKRPGRVKGRGELYVRFDSLTLPNGTTRDFRARIGQLDGRATEQLDQNEGKIKGDSNKGADAQRIGEIAAAGASVGAISGSVAGSPGMGVGIGAAAGAAAGLVAVLLTRGPEATLAKGTTLEMVLDRSLKFDDNDLAGAGQGSRNGRAIGDGPGPMPKSTQRNTPMPGRRMPL